MHQLQFIRHYTIGKMLKIHWWFWQVSLFRPFLLLWLDISFFIAIFIILSSLFIFDYHRNTLILETTALSCPIPRFCFIYHNIPADAYFVCHRIVLFISFCGMISYKNRGLTFILQFSPSNIWNMLVTQ